MELTNSTEDVNLIETRTRKNNRFDDNTLVFYENKCGDIPTQLNWPLYITAKVQDVELKRVLLDAGSYLNIISLDDIGIPREKIQKQPFEVSSFDGSRKYTVGSISLDFTVGPIRATHCFT